MSAMAVIARQAMNQKLFKQDGALIYTPHDECEKHRQKCQDEILDKIDDIKVLIREMDSKRDSSRQEMARQVGSLAEKVAFLAGEFKSFKHRNGGG